MRTDRGWLPLAVGVVGGIVALAAPGAYAEELTVALVGSEVRVRAPQLRLLTGRALERLRNGSALTFDFQLSAAEAGSIAVLKRAIERFVVSYDLWEERFSIAPLSRARSPGSGASNLNATAVEPWCLERLGLATEGLPMDRPLVVHLDVIAEDPKGREVVGEPGISLTALIEFFSRPAGRSQQRWSVQSGPLRLNELKR